MDDAERLEESQDEESNVAPSAGEMDQEAGEAEATGSSWDEFEAALAPATVARGDLVDATVVDVQNQAVVVDLGTKYEGVIPRDEFGTEEELPKVGDEIRVAIVNVDEENERIRVSKRRADYERVWGQLKEAMDQGAQVTAMVTERVRGGLRVDVGVPGFVPASHVVVRDVRHLDRFVGRTLPLRVVEVDRRTNKVILSHKAAVEEERKSRREKTLSRLYEGAVCEGRVVSLTNYGAFIDLGGLDGLLHISEMAWHHVDHPSEVLKKGDIVRVVVLAIEDEGNRISLSRREILPDPWKEVEGQFSVGQALEVEVTRMVSTGAFAKLPGLEVEGFIPIREMSEQRIKKPEDVLQLGQQVEVRIVDMQPPARKMTLSMVQAGAQRERAETQRILSSHQPAASGINLGEQFGDILRGALVPEKAPPQEAATEEAAGTEAQAEAEATKELSSAQDSQEQVESPPEEPGAEAPVETGGEEPTIEEPAETVEQRPEHEPAESVAEELAEEEDTEASAEEK